MCFVANYGCGWVYKSRKQTDNARGLPIRSFASTTCYIIDVFAYLYLISKQRGHWVYRLNDLVYTMWLCNMHNLGSPWFQTLLLTFPAFHIVTELKKINLLLPWVFYAFLW